MRLRDENKRRLILQTAGKLFSELPFHEVRLDDVAEASNVGKGTLYIYFKSKEDLYYSLIYDGFADIVRELNEQLQAEAVDGPGWSASGRITLIAKALVKFAFLYPQLFEAMRIVAPPGETQWEGKRRELVGLIEQVVREGVKSGELIDPHPELTALYLPAVVRAVMMYGPKDFDGDMLAGHIATIFLQGIRKAKT